MKLFAGLRGSNSSPTLPALERPISAEDAEAQAKAKKKQDKIDKLVNKDDSAERAQKEAEKEARRQARKAKKGEIVLEPKKKEVTLVDETMPLEELQQAALSKGIQFNMIKGKTAAEVIQAIRVVDPTMVTTVAAPTEVEDPNSRMSSKKEKKKRKELSENDFIILPHPPFTAAKQGTYQSAEARRMREKWEEAVRKHEEELKIEKEKMRVVRERLKNPAMFQALDTLVQEIARRKEGISDVYHSLDSDGDGGLSKAELGKGLRLLGVSLKPSELDALMRAFDIDGNEAIDYDEFNMLLTQHNEIMPQQTLDGDTALCGYTVGDRVRMAVQQCMRTYEDDGGDDAEYEKGTVLGMGKVPGKTVMVKLDASGQTLSLRPRQIKFIEHKPTGLLGQPKKSVPWL